MDCAQHNVFSSNSVRNTCYILSYHKLYSIGEYISTTHEHHIHFGLLKTFLNDCVVWSALLYKNKCQCLLKASLQRFEYITHFSLIHTNLILYIEALTYPTHTPTFG